MAALKVQSSRALSGRPGRDTVAGAGPGPIGSAFALVSAAP